MKKLLARLEVLENSSKDLEPNQNKRDELMNRIHSYANNFLQDIDINPSFSNNLKKEEDLSISGEKSSLEVILNKFTKEVVRKGINPASGGHLGYIPGGGIYSSAIADYLVDITNEYAGMYFGSPGAVNIENEVIDWLKAMFLYPNSAVGNLTSGGSIANLIALTSARDAHKIKGSKIEKSVIYLSEQVHHCIQKALKIIGLEDIIIRYVELDEGHRMKTEFLKLQIKKDKDLGLSPFLVVASAGTTDTGAVDPLLEIANISKSNDMWYHIDAAYGGFFILVDEKKKMFEGIELSDSLVIDPHKGLFIPYGVGVVLVKNIEAVFHSHHYTANYMQDTFAEGLPINPADVSPELTKHFRGLRVWLPLQLHGIDPFVACLEEKILLTEYFRIKLSELGFQIGPKPDLSVSYFWYPRDENQDQFNEHLMNEIHNDGSVFLSSSMIGGKYVIRIAVLSFRTKVKTIDKALQMIKSCLDKCLSSTNNESQH